MTTRVANTLNVSCFQLINPPWRRRPVLDAKLHVRVGYGARQLELVLLISVVILTLLGQGIEILRERSNRVGFFVLTLLAFLQEYYNVR